MAVLKFDIIEYLSGLTSFVFDKAVLNLLSAEFVMLKPMRILRRRIVTDARLRYSKPSYSDHTKRHLPQVSMVLTL